MRFGIIVFFILLQGSLFASAQQDDKTIGFNATATDKSWTLDINYVKRTLHFVSSKPSKMDLTMALPKLRHLPDDAGIMYNIMFDNGKLVDVIIYDEGCDDTTPFSHKTVLKVTNDSADIKTYTACGQYLGDYRLNAEWALESFNGKRIELKQGGGTPNITFDLSENMIFGFSGCNRYSGSMTLENNAIKTGMFATTRKSCLDMETENKYLQVISERTLTYTIDNMKLTISNGSDIFVFSKIE